jgi:3-phenylpropionate/trans-cinnamate dioxygenase ferredoxin reductase subunit
VVVIGAGLGGLRVIERLRRRGFDGDIELLGAERHPPYDRPPLSKHILRGERDQSWLATGEQLAELAVSVHLDSPATGLSPASSCVFTRDRKVGYDVAVIATGAVPRRIPGLGGMVLRTLDDALALRAALEAGGGFAIVGAGLVGCEVAASARAMGVEVALVDVLEAPAMRVLGAKVGARLAELHAAHGVQLRLGTGVAGFEPGQLTLADGQVVPADVVLEAIGVVPDVDWLTGSEIALDDGVVCDANGEASPNVYAVGDVARWAGRRHEHWTNVGHQADRVASVILGQEPPAADVPYWWSDQYDLKLQGLGCPGPDDDVELVTTGPQARLVAVYSKRGRLTGLVGFSAAGAVLRLRPEIATGADVGEVLERLAG